jgi:hypothetical protein
MEGLQNTVGASELKVQTIVESLQIRFQSVDSPQAESDSNDMVNDPHDETFVDN